MTESSCCFWKCNRNSRCRFCIMVCPDFGVIIIYLSTTPTVRSWWSQWVVMAACHCNLWCQSWCSDSLCTWLSQWAAMAHHYYLWWRRWWSDSLCTWLSQWAAMAHHYYLWWRRWWSDSLCVQDSSHKVKIALYCIVAFKLLLWRFLCIPMMYSGNWKRRNFCKSFPSKLL